MDVPEDDLFQWVSELVCEVLAGCGKTDGGLCSDCGHRCEALPVEELLAEVLVLLDDADDLAFAHELDFALGIKQGVVPPLLPPLQ